MTQMVMWDRGESRWRPIDQAGAPVVEVPVFLTVLLSAMTVGTSFSQQLLASESPTFAVQAGAFPAGIAMSSGGLITGVPTTDGSGSVTVRASNSAGHIDKSFSWTVAPVLSEWPNETNTGYLGNMGDLTTVSGSTINTPGAVYQNRLVNGQLLVSAANVTIRNCVINSGYWAIENTSAASGLVIEDCTIIGGLNCGIMLDGYSPNVTVRRCNISGSADGMKISGANITVQDCFIHDLAFDAEADTHNDGIQCYSGTGFQFLHNWIDSPDTSCIAMFAGQGDWDNILIQGNYFTGHPAYSIYAPGLPATNVRVLDNVFDGYVYQPVTDWQPTGTGWVWSGNVDPDDNPVNP